MLLAARDKGRGGAAQRELARHAVTATDHDAASLGHPILQVWLREAA